MHSATRLGFTTQHKSCKRFLWHFVSLLTNDVVDLTDDASAANVLSQLATIKPLDRTNYSNWRENIELMLGLSDLDYALTSARPAPPQVGEPNFENKVMKYDLERAK